MVVRSEILESREARTPSLGVHNSNVSFEWS